MIVVTEAVPLNVVASGDPDAPPVVLLHGVGNSRRTFGFLTEDPAAAGLRSLRVDLRGHGASPHTPGRYRLDDYVADVEAVLAASGPAVVVGHSLGGVVAWTLAQRRPDLVTAALLEDPPLYRGDPAEHRVNPAVAILALVRERAARWQAEGADPEQVAAAIAAGPAGPGREDAAAGEIQFPDAIAARAHGFLEIDLGVLDGVVDNSTLVGTDTATTPSVPVRVLAGDQRTGGVITAEHAERLRRDHPRVGWRRVDGAGHGIHDELAHRRPWVDDVVALARG